MNEKNTGLRLNQGKLRWRNFPLFLIRPLIQVAHYGEGKYDTYNFLKGQSFNTCYDSLMRHLDKLTDPTMSDEDDESTITHLGHIAWNSLVMAYMLKSRPDLDDRYKGNYDEKNIK